MAAVSIPIKELTPYDLPPVCVVTGAREGVTFKKVKFQWVPPMARFLVVFCGLVGVVAMLVMQKRAEGELPFSEEGWARWRSGKMLVGGGLVGFLLALFSGLFAMSTRSGEAFGLVLMLLGFVVLVVALVMARGRGPACKKIEDDTIELELPSADAASAFEERLRGGVRSAPRVAPAVA